AYYRPGDSDRPQGIGSMSGSGGGNPPSGSGSPPTSPTQTTSIVDSRNNTGIIAQTNASWRDQFFINTGLRLERNTGLSGIGEWETLPMFGAAFVRSLGLATVNEQTLRQTLGESPTRRFHSSLCCAAF